jgi:hypothetical protein
MTAARCAAGELGETLPEPYSYAEHHERFAGLSPSEKLEAFLRLPAWQHEAALSLQTALEARYKPSMAALAA